MKLSELIFLLILVQYLISCSKDGQIPENIENKDEKLITLSIGVYGEITDITTSPLKSTSIDDIYAIQVYTVKSNNTVEPYSYGVFDNITGLTIDLVEVKEYQFYCSVNKQVKDKVHFFTEWDAYSSFNVVTFNKGIPASINNDFIYTKETTVDFNSHGIRMVDGNNYEYPNIENFFGFIYRYEAVENGSVDIDMLRTSFGIKIVTENFTEGELQFKLKNDPTFSITYPILEFQDLFKFSGSELGVLNNEPFGQDISLSVNWIKNDSTVVSQVSAEPIKFYTNKLTTIKLKVSDITSESKSFSFGIVEDDTDMPEGDTYEFERGNEPTITTPVNP